MQHQYNWEQKQPTAFQIAFGIGAGIVTKLAILALAAAAVGILAWYGFAGLGFLLELV